MTESEIWVLLSWEQCLSAWLRNLNVGAELEVRDPDGSVAFLAPLARHYRLDEDDATVWLRPVVGGYTLEQGGPGHPPYAFHLNEARVRGISVADLRLDLEGLELVAPQASGQVAHIRPPGPSTREELDRWDLFVLNVLSAEEEAALDRVWGDSWWGDWA
jgi:hypothetical protein